MKSLTRDEYEKLKVFLGCFYEDYKKRSHHRAEIHPLAVLVSIEKASLPNAKRGLLMAINDMVEDSSDWMPDQVADADRRMTACDTYSLSEVRRRYSRTFLRVLQRGSISNIEEYYLLRVWQMVQASNRVPLKASRSRR